MRLTSFDKPIQRSPMFSSAARWMTPRLGFEIAAGSLAAVLLWMAWAPPSIDAPRASVAQKIPLQAPRAQPARFEEPTASQFFESVALAHVGPLRPETDITAPLSPAPPPLVAMSTKRIVAPREKRADGKLADAKPSEATKASSPRPVSPPKSLAAVQVGKVEPPSVELPKAAPQKSAAERMFGRMPLVATVVDKLPSGHDILDGAGALRRKITGLVSW